MKQSTKFWLLMLLALAAALFFGTMTRIELIKERQVLHYTYGTLFAICTMLCVAFTYLAARCKMRETFNFYER